LQRRLAAQRTSAAARGLGIDVGVGGEGTQRLRPGIERGNADMQRSRFAVAGRLKHGSRSLRGPARNSATTREKTEVGSGADIARGQSARFAPQASLSALI
jgi:hypothetical protein